MSTTETDTETANTRRTSIDGYSITSGETSDSNDGSNASFKKDDVIIALLGRTGTGKSSFANRVVGAPDVGVGHNLQSCTKEIRIFRHTSPTSSDLVIIDTPGFNDTTLSDVQILERITQWMVSTESAITIVSMLQSVRNHQALLVQTEMVDERKLLPETTVGQKVTSFLTNLRKKAEGVLFGLEARRMAEGWSQEIEREVQRQSQIIEDVEAVDQRWYSSFRRIFKLETIAEALESSTSPRATSFPFYLTSSLRFFTASNAHSGSAKLLAPPVSNQTSTSSSNYTMSPVYTVSLSEIPGHALRCLNHAASNLPSSPVANFNDLIRVSIFVVEKLEETWPEERSFGYPILHIAWFVLAVLNKVGERDSSSSTTMGSSKPLTTEPEDVNDTDGILVDGPKMKLESWVEALLSELTPFRHTMYNITEISSRQRSKRKRKAMDQLSYNAQIPILCGNLARYVKDDSLSLSIFQRDPTVRTLHLRISDTLLPPRYYMNEKQRKINDHEASMRHILGQNSLMQEKLTTVEKEVTGVYRHLETMSPVPPSPILPPGSKNIIQRMDCNFIINNPAPPNSSKRSNRRKSSASSILMSRFGNSRPQRKQSSLGTESYIPDMEDDEKTSA
ncbi:hypothetical protein CVT24_012696 [Panaeolus cyanescens]|uniref:AIG1-type G domain-containing protein n=1 Tax=Panaeolus cyanescens TaxID=181874 RepID=A0A409YK55_9AGAR|nr:hypothetical protein CVT24_012696 [Panaeolus cyanescens]